MVSSEIPMNQLWTLLPHRLIALGRDSTACHLGALGGISTVMVVMTWRCWPDPIVDFGRELYTAWRISEGEVLFRDIDGFYGPLSQYLNGILFWTFGPGLMVLVWANLAVFASLVAALYLLLRGGWQPLTALAATSVFVLIFGFSRFSTIGSFNFAAPYAHEVTHGMLVLVLLAHVLWHWRRSSRKWQPGVAGLLFGLSLLLKPEIVLVAAMATGFFLLERGRSTGNWSDRAEIVLWMTGAIVPTLGATVYFWQHCSFGSAVEAAGRAWLNVVATSDYVADPAQLRYLGLDAPLVRLGQHLSATAAALLAVGSVTGAGWICARLTAESARRALLLATVTASALVAYRWTVAGWMEVGRCMLGLSLAYFGWQLFRFWREPDVSCKGGRWVRLVLGVMAISLMARMLLNGRIYQFGFYQASLAGTIIAAALLEDVPACLRPHAFAEMAARLGIAVGLAVGVGLLVDQNRRTHGLITEPMGSGRDRFQTLREEVLWTNPILAGITEQMMSLPPGQTLVCLPEGLMVNYLARMRSPLPHFFYYSVVTERGRESRVVARLRQQPPDWVLLVPRGLEEYGISRYGERSGAGGEILAWVRANYDSVGHVAGEPMSFGRHQLEVFRRRQ